MHSLLHHIAFIEFVLLHRHRVIDLVVTSVIGTSPSCNSFCYATFAQLVSQYCLCVVHLVIRPLCDSFCNIAFMQFVSLYHLRVIHFVISPSYDLFRYIISVQFVSLYCLRAICFFLSEAF
jgi:hypothetical protein